MVQGGKLCRYFIIPTLAYFSIYDWRAENATLAALQFTSTANPTATGDLSKQHTHLLGVRYHFGGSMELNARILLLAYMVYL
jgi:hypothetical protein